MPVASIHSTAGTVVDSPPEGWGRSRAAPFLKRLSTRQRWKRSLQSIVLHGIPGSGGEPGWAPTSPQPPLPHSSMLMLLLSGGGLAAGGNGQMDGKDASSRNDVLCDGSSREVLHRLRFPRAKSPAGIFVSYPLSASWRFPALSSTVPRQGSLSVAGSSECLNNGDNPPTSVLQESRGSPGCDGGTGGGG